MTIILIFRKRTRSTSLNVCKVNNNNTIAMWRGEEIQSNNFTTVAGKWPHTSNDSNYVIIIYILTS